MNDKAQQKKAVRAFAEYWADKGYEKGQSQPFWLSLLRDVFGIPEPEKNISFEDQAVTYGEMIKGIINKHPELFAKLGVYRELLEENVI